MTISISRQLGIDRECAQPRLHLIEQVGVGRLRQQCCFVIGLVEAPDHRGKSRVEPVLGGLRVEIQPGKGVHIGIVRGKTVCVVSCQRDGAKEYIRTRFGPLVHRL
jgi:hypothetical protein